MKSRHGYNSGLILGLRPANEIRRYKVTPSVIGWAQPRISPVIDPLITSDAMIIVTLTMIIVTLTSFVNGPGRGLSAARGWCIPWWRHQMETFSALLAICARNSPVSGEFPTQRPVTRGFDVFFDLRPNKRLSKQSWGWWSETLSSSLWRHRNARR